MAVRCRKKKAQFIFEMLRCKIKITCNACAIYTSLRLTSTYFVIINLLMREYNTGRFSFCGFRETDKYCRLHLKTWYLRVIYQLNTAWNGRWLWFITYECKKVALTKLQQDSVSNADGNHTKSLSKCLNPRSVKREAQIRNRFEVMLNSQR